MSDPGPVVVVGASLAGARLALELRRQGWTEPVVLVGEEDGLPYERPQLSKGYLGGTRERRHLLVAPAQRYAEQEIQVRTGCRVTRVHPGARLVELADGARTGYGTLVLCTGARARRPRLPGTDLAGFHVLRTVQDADRLRESVRPGVRVVVIGMGLIGSEVAATLSLLGARVTAVDPLPAPMHQAVPGPVGRMVADLHRSHGVRLRLGVGVARITGRAQVEGVTLSDGTTLDADLAVAGVGAVPNTDLARDAGLACGTGVLTDELGRTSVAGVYAAGDVTEQFVPHRGRHERVEHWGHAITQALAVARTIAGDPTPVDLAPWFWSAQYDMHLEGGGWLDHGDDAPVPAATAGDDRWQHDVEGGIGAGGATGSFLVRSSRDGRLRALTTVGQGRRLRSELRQLPRAATSVPSGAGVAASSPTPSDRRA